MNSKTNSRETMDTTKSKKTVKKKKAVAKKKSTSKATVSVKKFDDLEGKFLLVKVGDDNRPATDSDIQDIESKLTALFEENDVNCLAFVTHHAVEMELIEKLT